MSEIVTRLLERRANLVEQMREVAERAVNESRDMSAEEDKQFTALNAEVDALQERADAMLEGEKRAKDIEESFAALNGKPQERAVPERSEFDEQIRSFLRSKHADDISVPVGYIAERQRGQGGVERRDVLTSTTGASGVIPTGFRAQLWEYMIETSGVLSTGVDLLETASGETIKLPRVTVHSDAAAVTEGNAIGEDDPTLGSVDSTVTKKGYVVQLSRDLIDDSGVDLQGYMARAAGRSLGNAVGAAAVTAAVAAASAGVTAANAIGAVTSFGTQSTEGEGFDFLIDLFHSVIAPYRNSSSCGWLMSDTTAATVRKIKDADGRYAWQPSVIAGQPDTILAKPVNIDTNVADPAASAKSLLFGDWRSLVVRIAGGFRFERSDDFAFDKDLVTFRAVTRHGSVSVDANALKSFVHAAS